MGPSASHEDWQSILASSKAALTGIGSLSVTDASGIIRDSTQRAIIGQSRADNYVFKRLAAATRDELVIDRPFVTPTQPPRVVIPFGRRLTIDGQFVGTVVATLVPEDHRHFFRTIHVGGEGVVWVFHPDGVVLFREPSETNPIGEVATDNPVFQAAQRAGAAGLLSGPLRPGGLEYLSAFHPVATPPLIVAVSLAREEILEDWYHERKVTSIGLGVLSVTLIVTVLILFRQIDATTKAEVGRRRRRPGSP